jgi:CP12 domain
LSHLLIALIIDEEFAMSTVAEVIHASIAQLEKDLQALRDEARKTCQPLSEDAISQGCAAAWDAVEEIQAELAHRRTATKTNFEQFCADRPDAAECRIYDV